MKNTDSAVYSQLYTLALSVAEGMGQSLQNLSWKWKNKPESQSASDKRAA